MKTLLIQIITKKKCTEIIEQLNLESASKYKLVSHDIVPLAAENGFMGQYFNLLVKVAKKNSENIKIIKFFIKAPPPSGTPQDEFNREMGSFKKEFDIYDKIFPKIKSLATDSCVPKCYLTLKDTLIVMEDLKEREFTIADKYKSLDYDHCSVVMETLGKFHAKSFLFEFATKRNFYNEFPSCVKETLWPSDKIRSMQMFNAAVKGVISMIDLLSDLNEIQKKKFKEEILNLAVCHPKNLLPSTKYKNVLCHGDLWANNIMFKYNESGNPINCCLIDFQLARYNPPAHDILCFLQFTTITELRTKRLEDLLHVYHVSLSHCLTQFGVNAAMIFPWQELVESVEKLRLTHMMHGILNIPMQLISEEAVKKYFVDENKSIKEDFHRDRSPLFCEQFKQEPNYQLRTKNSLLEIYEYIFGPIL